MKNITQNRPPPLSKSGRSSKLKVFLAPASMQVQAAASHFKRAQFYHTHLLECASDIAMLKILKMGKRQRFVKKPNSSKSLIYCER